MKDAAFMELGIYQITQDRFDHGYDRDLRREWSRIGRGGEFSRETVSEHSRFSVEQHFGETYSGPWRYNQAVGWLRLVFSGWDLMAEIWMRAARRFTRTGRGQIRLLGREFEIRCRPEQSSADIYGVLQAALAEYQAELAKRKFVLDLDCLRAIGPHVDRKAMAQPIAAGQPS